MPPSSVETKLEPPIVDPSTPIILISTSDLENGLEERKSENLGSFVAERKKSVMITRSKSKTDNGKYTEKELPKRQTLIGKKRTMSPMKP